jgi:NADH-quinone oxidoreductase subunit N
MKYFLLGAFSSGVLLYGISLLYGIAGSTNLGEIGREVARVVGLVSAPTAVGRACGQCFCSQ